MEIYENFKKELNKANKWLEEFEKREDGRKLLVMLWEKLLSEEGSTEQCDEWKKEKAKLEDEEKELKERERERTSGITHVLLLLQERFTAILLQTGNDR